MLVSESDLAAKYGLSIEELHRYEQAGFLASARADSGERELRVAVIAKALSVGFTFDEIKLILERFGSR